MDVKKVGKAIATLRKRAGFTQKDLAERIGITDKAVSKWERGVGMPDIGYLGKLSVLLNTDSESLLAGNAAINEKAWQGILSVPSTPNIGLMTYIYNKPLVYYLLGYYLLLGVRRILILCSEIEKIQLIELLGDGSKLGVELMISSKTLVESIQDIDADSIMFVYEKTILYGVDQTRFFQRAMQHKDAFSLLAFPKHGDLLTHLIHVDEDRRIVKNGNIADIKEFYDYSYIPFLFCPSKLFFKVNSTPEELVDRLIEENDGFAEALDRGFVEIKLHSWEDVNEASSFIKIIQNRCGMEIYCLEEIAWRRGLISYQQFEKSAKDYHGTAYGEYILSLCDRYKGLKLK